MLKVIQKIVNVLSVVIIVLSVLVLLVVVTTKKGQAPNLLGYSMFRVLTGSMEPTIPTESMIVIKRLDASELEVGDVISYYSLDPALNGAVNTHRIVSIDDTGDKTEFITKGDANNFDDIYPAREDLVIGKVIFISYRFGVLVRLLSNPVVFIPLIIVPFALIIITNLAKTVKLTQEIMREEEEAAVKEALEKVAELKKAKQKDDMDATK